MKKVLGLLKNIVGWTFLAFMVATSLFALGVIIVKRHQMANEEGLAFTLGALAIAAVFASLFVWWICRSYGIRSTVKVFGGFALLTLLFYGEEDWRGRHAWQSFKRESLDQNVKLDFVGMSPPRVPDDQNFAMTPIVASSYAAMLDREGREVIPRNNTVVNRLQMNVYGDNGKKPNTGTWAEGTMTDLKALQNYYRKLAKTNLFPVSPQPQSPARDVLLALSKYDSAVDELRVASRLPSSRFPLSYDKPNPAEILLPHLAALKTCCQMLALRAAAELQNDQPEPALDDATLALQLAGKIRTEPTLISQLVRIAMLQLALQPVWEGMVEKRWSEAQLVALDRELKALDFIADYDVAMHGEFCFGNEIIEYLRHADSPMREMNRLCGDDGKSVLRVEVIALILGPSGWYDQNHLAIAKFYQKWNFRVTDKEERIFMPEIVEAANRAFYSEMKPGDPSCVIGRMMLPGLNAVAKKFAHAQASADLARMAIALERHRLAEGDLPGSLEALTPRFMDSIPRDVIGGQPLRYHPTTNAQFVLYSVGWNATDDGGVVSYASKDKSPDLAAGDWVWFSTPADAKSSERVTR